MKIGGRADAVPQGQIDEGGTGQQVQHEQVEPPVEEYHARVQSQRT